MLAGLAKGIPPYQLERLQVDVKEEAGRRNPDGTVRAGAHQSEAAARHLAGEMACLANTPGGGGIVLGVADDGARVGTELDAEWLRHRIFELTGQRLTVAVREVDLDGTRLLVLETHQAIEPVRFEGKVKWRVDDHCVEVDPTTWHTGLLQRSGVDWSAQPSGHAISAASPVAVEIARRYLRAAGDSSAADLASATDADLLRRLNVVTGEGRLTNAGSLLFVGTPQVGVDYLRRDVPGGDSTHRIRGDGPLLEQVWNVDEVSQAMNRLVHTPGGFASGQLRAIPSRALREAVVNGVVHRDWVSPEPTTVEHVSDTLTVTSPGGFIGGIGPANIITHPSVPRYRSLAEVMASLRLAEREGIGVDRMVHDMLAVGRPEPEISEIEGPYVRVGLFGGEPDPQIVGLLVDIDPPEMANDVDALLLIEHLTRHGWVDVATAAPTLQRSLGETAEAVRRFSEARLRTSSGYHPVIASVDGVPIGAPDAYRLSSYTRLRLARRTAQLGTPERRRTQILSWVRIRGRVSSTEAADLTDLSGPYVRSILTALESEGLLFPARQNRLGRGFYYLPGPQLTTPQLTT